MSKATMTHVRYTVKDILTEGSPWSKDMQTDVDEMFRRFPVVNSKIIRGIYREAARAEAQRRNERERYEYRLARQERKSLNKMEQFMIAHGGRGIAPIA